jgi:hypothetical protein
MSLTGGSVVAVCDELPSMQSIRWVGSGRPDIRVALSFLRVYLYPLM